MVSAYPCEATEFSRRLCLAGAVVRHIDGGPRSMDVEIKIRGTVIARKSITYKRGKQSGAHYFLPKIPEVCL